MLAHPTLMLLAVGLSMASAGVEGETSTLSKLEALVGTMAAGQENAGAANRRETQNSDVVILEAEGPAPRRALGSCKCQDSLNGASPFTANCVKNINGRRTCVQLTSNSQNNYCPSDMTLCGQGYLKNPHGSIVGPMASPLPGRALDAGAVETVFGDEEDAEYYLNARVWLSAPVPDPLPAASEFGATLAQLVGVPSSHLLVEAASLRSAASSATNNSGAHLHLTVHASGANKMEDRKQMLEIRDALLRLSAGFDLKLAATSLKVASVDFYLSTAHPIVCAISLLRRKAGSRYELQQQMELTKHEVELLQPVLSSIVDGAHTSCSSAALSELDARLDVDVDSR